MQSGNRIASFPGKSRTNESLKGPTVVEILYAKIRKQCVYVGMYYRDHICIVGNQPQKLQILHTLEVCIGPLVRVSSIRNCDHMMKIQTVVRVFSLPIYSLLALITFVKWINSRFLL